MNEMSSHYPEGKNKTTTEVKYIHQILEMKAEYEPNKIAIISEYDEISYSTLDKESNRLANLIRSKIDNAGVHVGVIMDRSIETVITMFAIMKAGCIYVPIDCKLPDERICYILKDSDTQFVITQSKFYDKLYNLVDSKKIIDLGEEEYKEFSGKNLITKYNKNVYIIYTSGSTGNPKGVIVSQQAIINFLFEMKRKPGLTSMDTLLSVTTISFDISVLEIYLPILAGAKLVIASDEDVVSGNRMINLLSKYDITMMQATPTTWNILFSCGWNGKDNLKVLCGGESISQELANQLLDSTMEVWNMYGPTEATVWCSISKLEKKNKIHIGKPIYGFEFIVLDKYMNEVADGEKGELAISGIGLAEGYYNRDDLTNKKFPYLKISQGVSKRFYLSGDLVTRDDNGNFYYHGRLDNQVKINGYRIELEEIEKNVEKIKSVKEARVLVKNNLLICFFTSDQSEVNIIDLVEEKLKLSLPCYMIPNQITKIDNFPLTYNGKIDRKKLRASEFMDIMDECELQSVKKYSDIANVLKRIWSLELDRNVKYEDDFFYLGGSSLVANIISYKLKYEGIVVSANSILRNRTIKKIVTNQEYLYVNQEDLKSVSNEKFLRTQLNDRLVEQMYKFLSKCNVDKKNLEEYYPLTRVQTQLMTHNLLNRNSPVFIEQVSFKLEGNVSISILKRAYKNMIESCDRLRTLYSVTYTDSPMQFVLNNSCLDIEVVDYRDSDKNFFQDDLLYERRNFKLQEEVPFRFKVLILNTNHYYFVFTYHHIVFDGLSMQSILLFLFEEYNNILKNNVNVHRMFNRYSNYIRELQEDDESKKIKYWKDKQEIDSSSLEMKPRHLEKINESTFDVINYSLKENLTYRLKDVSKQLNVSPNILILTSWLLSISKVNNVNEIGVEIVISDQRVSIKETSGVFFDVVPLKIDVTSSKSFRNVIKEVSNELIKLKENSHICFFETGKNEAYNNFKTDQLIVLNDGGVTELTEKSGVLDLLDFKLSNVKMREFTPKNISVFIYKDQISISYMKSRYGLEEIRNILGEFNNILDKI